MFVATNRFLIIRFFHAFIVQVSFHTPRVGNCTIFSTTLSNDGKSGCLSSVRSRSDDGNDIVQDTTPEFRPRTIYERKSYPRSLDPNGYKYVLIYYT